MNSVRVRWVLIPAVALGLTACGQEGMEAARAISLAEQEPGEPGDAELALREPEQDVDGTRLASEEAATHGEASSASPSVQPAAIDGDLLHASQRVLESVLSDAGAVSDEDGLVFTEPSGATVTVTGRRLAAEEASVVAEAAASHGVADLDGPEGATMARREGKGFEQVVVVTDTHYFTVSAVAAPPASPDSPLPLSLDELQRSAREIMRGL